MNIVQLSELQLERVTRRGLVGVTASGLLRGQGASDESLAAELRRSATRLGLPGWVAGIVRDGKLAWVGTDGWADLQRQLPMRRDHLFPLASVTKTFTAVILMQYVQEKKISLDDEVLAYPFLSIGLSLDRLSDPSLQLKHVLSHTSEGTPGEHFIYNGRRYNFVYGVFEKVSGNTLHYEAGAQELRKRVLEPLGMDSTLPAYPTDRVDPRLPRVPTCYFLDRRHRVPTADDGITGATTMFPGTGMLSSVDDLAKYMVALDDGSLLKAESYERMTRPFVLRGGRRSSYGLGWSTQKVGEQAVHWHYGYGDSSAALLVRVPAKRTSFIFMSNSGAASAPFLLGFGNCLTSPFAVAFLERALPGAISPGDREAAQVFVEHFRETTLGGGGGEAKKLLLGLRRHPPGRFRQNDLAMLQLLLERQDPELASELASLTEAYVRAGAFHPDISLAIASEAERTGDRVKRDHFWRDVADRPGYGEQAAAREAKVRLGTELLRQGRRAVGGAYIWRAALEAKASGESMQAQEELVKRLRR